MAIADLDRSTSQAANLFSEKKFARHSADYYKKLDPEETERQFEDMKNGAMKILFASLKDKDPFNEDGKNGSDEIMQVSTSITQLTAAQAQLRNSNQVVEAIKNPGYSGAELQGMEIEYDDSKKDFNGKDPVTFNYKLEYDKKYEGNKAASIKTVIDIKNSKGQVVYTGHGEVTNGVHSFSWNGKDTAGKKILESGEYQISVRTTGNISDDNGQQRPLMVKATTRLSGTVMSVEMENGLTTNVRLDNGAVVKKSDINIIGEKKRKDVTPSTLADINMIGNEVEIDMSRFQIKDGVAEISYKNKIKDAKPGAKVDIFDEKGRKVKSLDLDYDLNNGYGSIKLKREISNLSDGNYTAKITLKDKENKEVVLEAKESVIVKGIKKDSNQIISLEGDEFNAHTIVATKGANFQSPLQQVETAFLNKRVKYPDDQIIVTKDNFEVSLDMPMMENGGLLYETELKIYNQNNELVNVVRAPNNLYAKLTEDAKAGLQDFMRDKGIDPAMGINKDQHLQINNEIKRLIDATPGLAKAIFGVDIGNKIKDGQIPVDVKWDGFFGPTSPKPGVAKPGEKYRFELHSSFKDTVDNISDKRYDYLAEDIVKEVTREDGEYYLHLENGDIIPYTKVTKVVDDKVK